MDSKTEPKQLSNDQLSSLVLLMLDSKESEYVKEYKARCLDGRISAPFLHALNAFEQVPTWRRQPLYEFMRKNWLADTIISRGKEDPAFYGKATSKSALDSIDKEVSKVASIFALISDITEISDITIDFVKDCIDSVKDQHGRYLKVLPERTHTGIRKVALALSRILGEPSLIQIAKSTRILKNRIIAHHESDSLPQQDFNEWLNLFQDYLNESLLKTTKLQYNSFNLFYKYLLSQENSYNPFIFLTKSHSYTFYNFLQDRSSTHSLTKRACTHMYDFTNWIIDNHLVERDEHAGETTRIGVPLFSPAEIRRITNTSPVVHKPAETVKHAMPTAWIIKCREIITENDFEWPKTRSNDYFWYNDSKGGPAQHIWVPVNAFIILTMLELPIRKIQVLSLDSGEGDEITYDVKQKIWTKNTSIHANYWKKISANRRNRGVIKRVYANGKQTAGFYINTNKTQDREHGFSETSGYTIPWNNEYLIQRLSDLRAWQEKYNPVDKPTRFKDIPRTIFNHRPTEIALAQIPDRFYLFRSPLANNGTSPDCPPSENVILRFWWDLMAELESRLKQEGQSVEIITKWNESTRQPEKSIFTPHGLRASGLTALSEAGVPIAILSKIVAGHSTILMTLYYMKMEPGHITEKLNAAKKVIEQGQQENLRQWLASAEWSEAQRYVIRNDDATLKGMKEGLIPTGLWTNNNLGICPYGGTRCHDGGELIRRSNKNKPALHAPVPGGDQNCVRCRHFVTGTPWMIPLWLHANKLLLDAQRRSKSMDGLRKKLDSSTSERFRMAKDAKVDSIPAALQAEIQGLENLLEKESNALDSILMDAHATYRLLAGVRQVLSGNDSTEEGNTLPRLIATDLPEIGFDEVSELRALDEIVQAGRLYTHISDNNIENERNRFVDQIMFNNGMTPVSLAPLTEAEKSAASDAAAKFLVTRLEDYELEALSSNRTTLRELNIHLELENTLQLNGPNFPSSLAFKPDGQGS